MELGEREPLSFVGYFSECTVIEDFFSFISLMDEQYIADIFQLKKLAEKEALLEAYLFLSVQLVWWIDAAITSRYSI